MVSMVKPVNPAVASVLQLEALALHRRGRSAEAVGILDRSTSIDNATSLLLRARVSMTLSPSGAIATLRDPRFSHYSAKNQAEAAMLRGRAHTKLSTFDTAEQCFTEAHALLRDDGGDNAELYREIELSIGTMLIAQARVDEAECIATQLFDNEKSSSSPAAATFVLFAKVAWQREQLDKNAGYLLQALRAISADASPDVSLWADTVKRLAHVLQYVPSPAVREAVSRHVTELPWTDELADLRAEVYRLLGTRACIDGAITEALALYKRASTTPAASLTIRIAAILNRAELSRWLCEPFSFEDHLLEATALAQQIDWRSAAVGSREILLLLAQMHAHRDSALALSFAAHFEALGGFGLNSAGAGGIADAQQNYCLGLLYAQTGEHEKGVGMLEAAFAELVRLRFDWAAGQTAIVLAELTNSTLWRARARELVARYPQSHLHKRLAQLDHIGGSAQRKTPDRVHDDPRVTLLTAAQKIVYYRLLENVSVKQIAIDLERSDLTVRNHIQAIFRKFKINARADLVGPRRQGR